MPIIHDLLMGLKIQLTGRRFKDLRKQLGLTRYRVSKLSKVSYRTLEIWDKGLVMPRSHTALRVGRALGIVTPEIEEKLKAQKEHYHERQNKNGEDNALQIGTKKS